VPGAQRRIYHVTANGLEAHRGDPAPITLRAPETAGTAGQLWCIYGVTPDGALDQNEERGRMAFFETGPLDADLEILGFPMLRTRVASDVPQANLAAVLSIVAPDGRARLVSFGVLNLTHRDDHANPAPLPPGTPVDATVQLNVIGQRIPAGYRLRLALSNAYWPLIWPSPERATLSLTDTRLDLPVHLAGQEAGPLPDFDPPEGAPPLETEILEPGGHTRTRVHDVGTGTEIHTRFSDSGLERHRHTGIAVRDICEERFAIHPDDPNSAEGTCRWQKTYRRGDWHADLDTQVSVRALADTWQIDATLIARDADGIVTERRWSEAVTRDLV
jgi:hypothetical protein